MRKEASVVIALATLLAAGCAGGSGGAVPPQTDASTNIQTGMIGNGIPPSGSAGPMCTASAFPYGVLAVSPNGTLTVDRGTEVDTSIGLAGPNSTFSASKAAADNVFVLASNAKKGTANGAVDTQRLNAAASSARQLSEQLAKLPATNAMATLVREGSTSGADLYHQSAPIDIVGSAGRNVLNLTDLNVQGTTITLHGDPAGSTFVINVSRELRLYNASLLLADGLTPANVIVNVTGGGAAEKNASLPKNGPEGATGVQASQAQWIDIKSEDDSHGEANEPRTTFAATLLAPNRQNAWIETVDVQGAVVIGTGTLHERALFRGCR